MCANAVALRHDIGLELGQRMHVSSYGMLGYALLTSATFGDALRLALRYPALLGTLFELSLEEDGERIWFTAGDYREDPALAAFNVELCLASLKVICDDLLGHPLPLLGARFEYSAPDYQARYAERFACPLQFKATSQCLCLRQTAGSTNRCPWPTPSPTRPWPSAAANKTPSSPGARPGWAACANCWRRNCTPRRGWMDWPSR